MNSPLGILGSVGLGAALAYVLDPDRGRRRRALARDKVVSLTHAAADAYDMTSRDLAQRTRGVIAEARSRLVEREPVDDAVLVERVRARLGGLVSHPSSIEVSADNGCVTLAGPILAAEAQRLVRRVRGMRGVRQVENRLTVHETAEGVPGLPGQGRLGRAGERFELLQDHWSPAARLLTGAGGGALGFWGFLRGGLVGGVLAVAGGALLARAITDASPRRLSAAVPRDGRDDVTGRRHLG